MLGSWRGVIATPAALHKAVAAALYPAYVSERDATKALLSERDQLIAALLEVQQQHATEEAFYPDANGCLRLSAGHVEGYAAADAVRHSPVTTLAGLVDKHLEEQARPPPTPSTSADLPPQRRLRLLSVKLAASN